MFEASNDSKRFNATKTDEKGRLRCPMCKGRGYFEPSDYAESKNENYSLKEKDPIFRLPALERKESVKDTTKPRKRISLPSIGKTKNVHNEHKQSHEEKGFSNNLNTRSGSKTSNFSQKLYVPKTATSNDSDLDNPLIPSPKTPKNPQDFLKSSLAKLKGNDWNASISGLTDIIQISRYQPDLLEGSLALIYRTVITMVKSFRSKITRTACQASTELFSNAPYTQRPEFDELVSVLLQKTADTNKFVRRDANEALDSMVIHIQPIHSARTIVQKGIPHRNAVVRAAAARLLVCLVGVIGVNNVYMGNKEMRNRIFNAGALCVQDGCQEVRSYGYRVMKMLMDHVDFEEVLQGCVSTSLLNRIEKVLITIKYRQQ